MDPSRFDSFVHALGRALSRRRALAALLAGLPVALPSARETAGKGKRKHNREHQKPKNKNKNKNKRKGDGQDATEPGPGPCYPGKQCQPGRGAANAGCDFSGSSLFRNLNARGAVLTGANLSGADLSGADLRGAVLRNACLVGADLTDAVIDHSTVLNGVIFCGTNMPDGSTDNSGCDTPTACCPTGLGGPGGGACLRPWLPQITFGSKGDGPSQFDTAQGVAVSADGQTVWVADTDNHRIAVWTRAGGAWINQATFGSKGDGPDQFDTPQGVAVAADGRTVWVADTDNSRIAVWTKVGDTWTPQATFGSKGDGPSQFDHPQGVAVSADDRTAWVVDTRNRRIAVWIKPGHTWINQTTFGSLGDGPDQFRAPAGLTVSPDGTTVWVADTFNDRIAVWTQAAGGAWTPQTTFGSQVAGPSAFNTPQGVAVSADGQTAWVADAGNSRIAVWTKAGGAWTFQTSFGSVGRGPGQFVIPYGIAVAADGQTAWVADSGNSRIAVWTKSGGTWTPQTTFGRAGDGPSQFANPQGVAAATDGQTVWVADDFNSRVSVWAKAGGAWTNQTTFGSFGAGPSQLNFPQGVAVAADGQTAWVADLNNSRIAVWTKVGGDWRPQTTFGGNGSGPSQFNRPFGVVVAADGQTVWVADTGNSRIAVWTKSGAAWAPQSTFGSDGNGRSQFARPQGVVVAADGQTVWVADTGNSRIAVWIKAGDTWTARSTFGGRGAGPDQFNRPRGVAVAADGQTVWVADTRNSRIAVWTDAGGDWAPQLTFGSPGSGPSELFVPAGVAVAVDGKTAWVADTNNSRIAVWTFGCSDS